jgi:hypothetical protein
MISWGRRESRGSSREEAVAVVPGAPAGSKTCSMGSSPGWTEVPGSSLVVGAVVDPRWSSTLVDRGLSSGSMIYLRGSGSVEEWDSSNRNSRNLKTYSLPLQMQPTSSWQIAKSSICSSVDKIQIFGWLFSSAALQKNRQKSWKLWPLKIKVSSRFLLQIAIKPLVSAQTMESKKNKNL